MIFIPMTKRLIVKCNVKFMEDKAFRRSREFLVDDQTEQLVEAPRPSQGWQSICIVSSTSVCSRGEDS